jgi:hypothetical protein
MLQGTEKSHCCPSKETHQVSAKEYHIAAAVIHVGSTATFKSNNTCHSIAERGDFLTYPK